MWFFKKISLAIFLPILLFIFCQNAQPKIDGTAQIQPVSQAKNLPENQKIDDLKEDLNYLTGKFDPEKHPDFVKIGEPWANKPGMILRREAFEAFKKMWFAAKKDGVKLNIISSTRNFQKQKTIWEGKWSRFSKTHPDQVARARKILEYSSMPGTSRHHWGTDVDLNDLTNESFSKGGKNEKVYEWLLKNAAEFGFGQPYTAGRPTGYFEERWHWSYLPLSKPFLKKYLAEMDDSKISGFAGAETAMEIGAVKNFAGGVSAKMFED